MQETLVDTLTFCLKERHGMTPSEIRICEFLSRGNSRADIRRLMDINENCLKWHLKQIYAKTIGDAPNERDKLHRLTVMLWRVQKGENYP